MSRTAELRRQIARCEQEQRLCEAKPPCLGAKHGWMDWEIEKQLLLAEMEGQMAIPRKKHMAKRDENGYLCRLCTPAHPQILARWGGNWTFFEHRVTCKRCLAAMKRKGVTHG